ncbi:hypothetical protein FRC07_003954, partial [Ceratobasidium sp. 392]
LSLGNGTSGFMEDTYSKPGSKRVTLPLLEELTLADTHSVLWTRDFFSVFDAPKLDYFCINTTKFSREVMSDVAALIATGPMFPNLRHLATNLRYGALNALWLGYPALEVLTLSGDRQADSVEALGKPPHPLVNLRYLKVADSDGCEPYMSDMVQARKAGGVSVPIVIPWKNVAGDILVHLSGTATERAYSYDTPVLGVPNEILSLIFIEGATADWYSRRTRQYSTHREHEFRDTITWVCHHWRTVALNIPSIWARIDLADTYPYPRSLRYLARIGPVEPLHVHLDTNEKFFWGINEENFQELWTKIDEALKVIIERGGSTDRWKTFYLDFSGAEIDAWLFVSNFLSKASFDILESFTLVGHQRWLWLLWGSSFSDLAPAISNPKPSNSQLRSVHFNMFTMRYLRTQIGTTLLSNLTFLEVEICDSLPSVVELCTMLADNPNLRNFRLTLGGDFLNELGPPPRERVCLPLLEELVLNSISSEPWVFQLLSGLDAPKLKDLWVDVWNLATRGLPNLDINPVFPNLQHLATNIRQESLGALLLVHPNLVKLTLLNGYETESIAALGREPWLLPRLGDLGVSNFPRDALPLARMIGARQGSGVSAPNLVSYRTVCRFCFT